MKSLIQKLLLVLSLSSSCCMLNMHATTSEVSSEELELTYAVFDRWAGQEHRIQQLMYESTLSDKQLEYFNGNDHVATFDNENQIVITYLENGQGKIGAVMPYDQMLYIVEFIAQAS